jgi:hypothetical protein
MSAVIFTWFLMIGIIIPEGDVDGRPTYIINSVDGISEPIEHAYKGEILEYIETGSFEYNEFLED